MMTHSVINKNVLCRVNVLVDFVSGESVRLYTANLVHVLNSTSLFYAMQQDPTSSYRSHCKTHVFSTVPLHKRAKQKKAMPDR